MSSSPRRLRDALVAAMLPSPGSGLPAARELDLDGFWARFDASAPAHLRLGLAVSVVTLTLVAPRAFGFAHALPDLDADAQDEVLARAARSLPFAPLVEIGKVVVGLAYFADPRVEAHVRSRS